MGREDQILNKEVISLAKTRCVCVPEKKNGGYDHRYNKGNDRTPAQRSGDSKRSK